MKFGFSNSENGFGNFLPFIGIVESTGDETNAGRVKVRAVDIHPPIETGEVTTPQLPWAVPLNGTYKSVVNTPSVGEWVFGFFADGRDAQHPFLLGTIPGFNNQPAPSSPGNQYLANTQEAAEKYGKGPLHHAQTGEFIDDRAMLTLAAQRAELVQGTEAKRAEN